jgi:2'-5' RNA ligase
MKYFVGIVPPQGIYNTLLNIQEQYGDNRLEPHITLRPPVNPTDDLGWLKHIEAVAAATQPFNVHLPGTGNFGKRVMFVRVESPAMEVLQATLTATIKEFEPPEIKKDFEGFHPHLTLARAWCGFSPEDFKNMRKLADEYLHNKEINFQVSHLRVYHKPDPHGRYQTYKDFSLGSTR